MTAPSSPVPAADPDLIRFEVRDGMRRVSCIVSDEALDAASGSAAPATVTSRRRSFDRFRTLIHAAALLRLRAMPPGSMGPIVLTRGDLRSVPPQTGMPAFGIAPRMPGGETPATATAKPARNLTSS